MAGRRYVRLWNYAEGAAEDAIISLDFGDLDGGFLLPGEADPVWAGDVDRMFVSLVSPEFDGSDAFLAAPAEGWVELTEMACDGSLFVEEGDEIIGVGRTGLAATMGSCLTISGEGSALLFDDAGTLDVELLAGDMVLVGASDDMLLRGANLCLVGAELLQFGRAEQTGVRQYRLSRLLRGRRGTEWAITSHVGGESFLLIEADALVSVPDAYVRTGSMLTMLALGVGDVEPAEAVLNVSGEALKPPSPVRLTIDLDELGDRTVRWTRRSRSGWAWADHVDAPLGEELERYRLRVMAGATVLRSVEIAVPEYVYSAEMAAADVAAGGSALMLEVIQIGARGISRPVVGLVDL